MDFNKYKNDGWGLSLKQLTEINDIINDFEKNNIRIIEFGSGKSTSFLVDIAKTNKKNITITSFDNDVNYAYTLQEGDEKFLDLKIRNLIECSNESYNEMFHLKKFNKNSCYNKVSELTTRQVNNFYQINDTDLIGVYDIMILDGPNGNGRNLSFLHMQSYLDTGSVVLIDDVSHYDFLQKFELFFDHEILYSSSTGIENQWNLGGDYIITKIISKK